MNKITCLKYLVIATLSLGAASAQSILLKSDPNTNQAHLFKTITVERQAQNYEIRWESENTLYFQVIYRGNLNNLANQVPIAVLKPEIRSFGDADNYIVAPKAGVSYRKVGNITRLDLTVPTGFKYCLKCINNGKIQEITQFNNFTSKTEFIYEDRNKDNSNYFLEPVIPDYNYSIALVEFTDASKFQSDVTYLGNKTLTNDFVIIEKRVIR